MIGWRVEQGFNDTTTDYYKGHLAIDLTNNGNSSNIHPISTGTVVFIDNTNKKANGNIIVIESDINGKKYYSSYSHLANKSIPSDLSVGDSVDTDTTIGKMGGTNGTKKEFSAHLHLMIYTGDAFSTNPSGYSDPSKTVPFPVANDYFEKNGKIFYDPMKFINSNGQISVK